MTTLIEYMLESCVCGDCADHEDPDPGCKPIITRDDMVWQICERCGGEGTLGGWAGAYTESDRAEWSYEDYDDYFNTSRPCEDCDGSGKVKMLSDEAWARPEVVAYSRDFWADAAVEAQERAMGA
jgi:RecJ-like exonuclease